MTTEMIDCEHLIDGTGKVAFMFYLGGGKSVCLCDMCYQRFRGEMLQSTLNEAVCQAVKAMGPIRVVGK